VGRDVGVSVNRFSFIEIEGVYWKMTEQEQKEYMKQWHKAHKEEEKAWREANRKRLKAHTEKHWESYINAWHEWLVAHGYGIPCKEMHYHHEDEDSRSFVIGRWLHRHSLSPENIELLEEELEKCVYIPAKEHKQLHWQLT
jgi:hypothetical protein